MAKANILSQIVAYASVIWFRERNRARSAGDYGKSDDLLRSMTERGWVLDEDGTVRVEECTPEMLERALTLRQEEWDRLKTQAAADPTKSIDLVVWEERFVSNGKLIKPTYVGVTGNRRDSVSQDASVARRKKGEAIITEIPVIVRHYGSAMERLADQVGENHFKGLGAVLPSDQDNLIAARELVEYGASQADLRRTFKDGVGQKLWGICALNNRFPELRIIERMLLKPEDEGFINMKAVHYKDLPTMLTRSNAEELAKKNESLLNQGKETLRPADADDVMRYLSAPKAEGNAAKVMKGETVRNLSESFPCVAIRAAFKAVADNSIDELKPYRELYATTLNGVDTLVKSDDLPQIEYVVSKLVLAKGEARQALFDRIIAAIDNA